MTIRPRAARALLDARSKLRDIAAATHAQAAAQRDRTHLALVEEQDALDAHLDTASELLTAAASVWDLDEVSEITGVHKLQIKDAETRVAQATATSDATAAKLRESSRKLRTAEQILDRVTTERDKAIASAEQRTNDDMVAARTNR